jgi:hypothetical protein
VLIDQIAFLLLKFLLNIQYSKVYNVCLGATSVLSEVPKKVRDLDKAIGLNVFPTIPKS